MNKYIMDTYSMDGHVRTLRRGKMIQNEKVP
jgi:hypothetical protein